MSYEIVERSARWIILEAVYAKVPYEVYDAIWKVDSLESLNDLRSILSEDDFETVKECVKLYFFRQAICNYMKFLEICGRDSDGLSEGISIEW